MENAVRGRSVIENDIGDLARRVFVIHFTRVNLSYKLVVTTIDYFPDLVRESRPRISMSTSRKGSHGTDSSSLRL